MTGSSELHVDPELLQGYAQALVGGAEELRARLAELDAHVGELLHGWRGSSGEAFASAWELWHRGAGEVELGLSMLGRLVAQAGGGYRANEHASAAAVRGLSRG
ncbi:WXG100 family type VII secretion target [Mycobacterium sp. 1423905.2]|uniref:WXG100 family type VII secretion target n=1 Tax=Mycobacterium sp. 1423905.2 TaxID=1856859 RepID=UPI0007FCA5CE|nr:WXG100 family type VII secretion target [Mycobacterium sp. 1423905.2]OBJ48180.1 secretion protein [Mycobacterium sp. 1423905.2]